MTVKIGLDDIDGADTFEFENNNSISISSNGAVLQPKRPSFYAYHTSGVSSRSVGTLVFNATRNNNGNAYNTSNGRFTVPVSGIYEFHGTLLYRSDGSGTSAEITFFLNGSQINSRGIAYADFQSDGGHLSINISWIDNFTSGDYVTLGIERAPSSPADFYYGQNLAFFTGKLIS